MIGRCFLVVFLFVSLNFSFAQEEENILEKYTSAEADFDKSLDYFKKQDNEFFEKNSIPLKNYLSKKLDTEITTSQVNISLLLLGKVYFYSNNFKNAIDVLLEINDKDKFGLNAEDELVRDYILYRSFSEIKNYKASINYLDRIKEYQTKVPKNSEVYKSIFNYLLTTEAFYFKAGLYQQAVDELKPKFKERLKAGKDLYLIMNNANNLGVYFLNLKQGDSAKHYFKIAREFLHRNKNIKSEQQFNDIDGLISGNLGKAYFLLREYHKAIPLFKENIERSSAQNPTNALNSAISWAEAELRLGNLETAKEALDKASEVYNSMSSNAAVESKINYKFTLAEYYNLKNEKVKAFNTLNEVVFLKDTLIKRKSDAFQEESQLAYLVSIKDQQLKSKEEELNSLKDTESAHNISMDKARLRIWVFGFLFIVFLFISGFLFYYNLKKTRNRKELKKLNDEIANNHRLLENALQEKEKLGQEISKQLNSNLQLIVGLIEMSGELTGLDNKTIIENINNRIRSIVFIHEILLKSDNLNSVNMYDFFTEIAQRKLLDNKPLGIVFDFSVNAKGVFEDVNTAINTGMIVYELIKNTIHNPIKPVEGFKFTIYMIAIDQQREIIFKDNNPVEVTSEGKLVNQEYNLGFILINKLVDELEGTYEIQNRNGMYFSLKF
ncbi:histidine kinase dimerization/phosphoacceptor domain -containing protein [Zhouia sp. PK063]|uniref:histidine kinase dimerization/phosphoacceptor domain -containing protein n=1 Tax=Zhouia sp. PK063 TaxID=3373602 RepID=UPI0037B447C5